MNANCGYQIQQAQTNKILLWLSSSRSSLEIFCDKFECMAGLWEALGYHAPPQRLKYCRFKISDQPIINTLTRVWWSSHISFNKYKAEKCTGLYSWQTGRWYNQYKIKCFQFHSRKANSGLDFRITILTWWKIIKIAHIQGPGLGRFQRDQKMFRLDMNLFWEGILAGILGRPIDQIWKFFGSRNTLIELWKFQISKILRIQMRTGIGILNQSKAKSAQGKWTRVSKLFFFNSYASELKLFALYMIISKDVRKCVHFQDNVRRSS